MKADWWDELLATHAEEGAHDAERGVFNKPYPDSDDPMEDSENWAYESGWKQRRKDLGDAFRWEQ